MSKNPSTTVQLAEYPDAAALADALANPTVTQLAALIMGFNGTTWDRFRVPTVFTRVNGVDISTIANVWDPTAGKKFRLMGGTFSVDVAESVLFEDNAADAFVFQTPTLGVDTPYFFDLGPIGVLSAAADNILKATATGAGTVTMTGTLYGTEE